MARLPGTPSRRTASPPAVDRALQAIGADPSFAEAVLGDLSEEFAMRAERDGWGAARWWYVREAARSTPHLLRSALRSASPARRARWAAYVAGSVALAAAAIVLVMAASAGPPARLVAGDGGAEGVTVNNRFPVALPLRVLDARGRELDGRAVRYRWTSGAPVTLSPTGVITCTRQGDLTVRASLGLLSTRFLVRCRPVKDIRATIWNDFVVGDPERELPVDFVAPDGGFVTRIAGRLKIRDSTIATVNGMRIRPVSPGRTFLELSVGDAATSAAVTVFEPVPSLEGLRPDQRAVAVRVRLTRGESVRWSLPTGLFELAIMPGPDRTTSPTVRVDGPVMCLPSLRPGVSRSRCLVRSGGASLIVAHAGLAGGVVAAGSIGLQREDDTPWPTSTPRARRQRQPS